MPHSGLYLHQATTVPGACKADHATSSSTDSQSITKQVRVARNSSPGNTSIRTSRSQSSVIDAEPVCWRVKPTFLEKLQKVTAEGAPVIERPTNEAHREKFGDNSCEASTTSRSSGKQRSFYSRPDMIRWRLMVEGVQSEKQRHSQQLQDIIVFLESLGLDSSKMMVKYPLLSTTSVENIRAVVRFLESRKLRRKDVVKVLSNNPSLLGHSVEESFLPVVSFLLTEVGLQEKDVTKVVIRCGRLLTSSVDTQLRPTLRFLQELGFKHMAAVVANNATLLASSMENRLIPKMEWLIGLGLAKEEAVQALIRFPAIFNYSIETNLQPKWNYLVDDMGRGLADLQAFPQYFGYSLECRISPRYLFLKKRNLSLPLDALLKPTDEVFYARFQHEKLVEANQAAKVSEHSRPP